MKDIESAQNYGNSVVDGVKANGVASQMGVLMWKNFTNKVDDSKHQIMASLRECLFARRANNMDEFAGMFGGRDIVAEAESGVEKKSVEDLLEITSDKAFDNIQDLFKAMKLTNKIIEVLLDVQVVANFYY